MNRAAVAPRYARADGYAALGLAANPFAAEQQPGVAPHLWISRDDEPPMPQPGARQLVQLIGPKGAGKTSLLLRWRDQQPGPYHYVAPGSPRWRFPPLASLVYWDELDRMATPVRALALLAAAASGATVVAGSHVDLAASARRFAVWRPSPTRLRRSRLRCCIAGPAGGSSRRGCRGRPPR